MALDLGSLVTESLVVRMGGYTGMSVNSDLIMQ